MSVVVDGSSAWAVRRVRAVMLQTLPDLPDALCKDSKTPDLWHPERPTRQQEEEAKSICRRCPEQVECLAYALRVHRVPGIWGAMTEGERVLLVESVSLRLSVVVDS